LLGTSNQDSEKGRACSAHGEIENTYNIFVENIKRRDDSEDERVDKRILLKWSVENMVEGNLTTRAW
jgi:hypothetical protein